MNEWDVFAQLCRDCVRAPDDATLLEQFDLLYGPIVDRWMQLCFPHVSEDLRPALFRIIRRWAIEEGAKGGRSPGQVISLAAVEIRRAMRELGWSPGRLA